MSEAHPVGTRRARVTPSVPVLVGAGLIGTALLILGILVLAATGTYEAVGALLVAPTLIVITIPALKRQARREENTKLYWLLLGALVLKLAGAFVNYFVAYDVYGGAFDASLYHESGLALYQQFRVGNFAIHPQLSLGTDFIRGLTGGIYALIGPTGLGGFLVFSWLGFLGLYFFYRAYTVAVPEGRRRAYAIFLFFLPSLWFWPSSIGKEAWMMFALGLAALGTARMMAGRIRWRTLALTALGLWLATLVRPHVAGLVALALIAGYFFRRSRSELPFVGTLAKGVVLAGLVFAALILVSRTERFLHEAAFQTDRGVAAVLQESSQRTAWGGSRFAPPILVSPLRAPVATITVLFRPILVDAHNLTALVASIEGTFLLGFSLYRWRWILAALRSIRRQPYVAFAFAYTGLFVLAFSGFANFGLLARERVQVLPLYLILLTIPPPTGSGDERDRRRGLGRRIPRRLVMGPRNA